MNTSDFVKEFAETYNVSAGSADAWVRSIFEYLGEYIVRYPEVRIAKLGVFKHIYTPAQGYTDFKTGEFKKSKPRLKVGYVMSKKIDEDMRGVPVPDETVKTSRKKSNFPTRLHKNLEVEEVEPIPEDEPDGT